MKALFVLLALLATPAFAQNTPGLKPEGTIVPGNCVKFGTSQTRAADAGAPCLTTASPQQLSIGQNVNGAVINKCLIVDANGKLAQADCLTAQ